MDKVTQTSTTNHPASADVDQTLLAEEPPYCECARTGKRSLSWAAWVPGLSANPLSAALNKEFAHEHVIFDQSRDNIGYGPHGLFKEDVDKMSYRLDGDCFDGSLMRQAVEETEPPSVYLFFMRNCQTYVERVRDTYQRLKG